MKHLNINIGLIIGLLSLLVLNACKDNIDPINDALKFDRAFTPLGLTAKITNQTVLTLEWEPVYGIDSYTVEISDDSLEFADIIYTATVSANEIPYVYDLPSGDTQYSVRVKSISTADGVDDSKYSTVAFKSLPENLFEGYDLRMDAIGALTLNWLPGKAVTSLLFVTGSGETSFDISGAEATAGEKSVTGLLNDVYEIRLMNGDAVRGQQNYVMEGDAIVSSGGDLAAAIAAASSGDVILLTSGEKYGIAGGMYVTKSIKIKGLDGQELPTVYPTSGNQMFIVDPSMPTTDSLVFENLHMSGLVNLAEGTGIRGIFDQEDASMACNIAAIKFKGCILTDWGRQIVRLRGGADQIINEVLINNCIIRNLGKNSASYGIISAEKAETNIGFIKISNSTIDSVRSHIIRYPSGTACNSIVVENCTFNRAPFSSGRYVMDLRDNAFIGNGVRIINSILGNTEYDDDPTVSSVIGIRVSDAAFLSISNTYVTDDFDDSADYSIPAFMLLPAGVSSTNLWTDPVNGDFTFKGTALDAGDPRWK